MEENEKKLIRNIQTHDLAESLRIRRAKLAEEAGLPANQFALPFPPSVTILREKSESALTNPGPPTPMTGIAKAAILAAGLGMGGLGGAGLASYLGNAAANVATIGATSPSSVPAQAAPQEYMVRWWIDGAEVKTEVQPVKPPEAAPK